MKNRRMSKIIALLMTLALLSAAIVATAMTVQAAAPSTYTDIALDSAQSISVSGNGRYYRFIPSVGGTYEISSYNCTSGDPYVCLLDANGNTITYNDDGNGNLNFKITYRLEAGVTYYINARSYSNSSYYTFKITALELDAPMTPPVTPNLGNGNVLVIKDREPWSKNSIPYMMNQLKNQDFINEWNSISTSSVTLEVMSAYDVVYVAGDQSSASQSIIKGLKTTFEQYVRGGGVLVYSFLTMGDAYGNNLPGGVTSRYGSNHNNRITDSTHPIITCEFSNGISLTNSDMTGSSASHDYLDASTLPVGSRVIVTTSDNKPTLAEYTIGDGTVIASGMTWEYYAQTSSGEGGFARKAYDDLFIYALSISTASTCEHEYVEGDYVEPTCTEQGYTAYNCTLCGSVDRRDPVPQLGHETSGWIIDMDATCEMSGTKHTSCERCGEYLENVYIPPLGHNYTSVVTRESNCTEPGIITYTCQNCSDTYNTYVYSEHRYSLSEHVDATCESDGYDKFTCSLCNDSYTNAIPGGHDYIAEVVAIATEEEEGLITYTCEYCNDSYDEIVPTRPDASVLLIQDRIPWSRNANVELLNALVSGEYISGWDMVTTDEFDASVLAEYKVVMIANDQTTATYDRLAEINESLISFAEAGGVVIYGACDSGWAGGSIHSSLPLGVEKENYYSRYNYIANKEHDIILAKYTNGQRLTEDLLNGNYCSHSYFKADTLPDGADIILQDGQGNPTLVEYAVGDGYVIASGLTWEFYYSYGGANYSKSIFDDLVVYATYLTGTCDHIFDVGEYVASTCAQAGHLLHTCMNCGMTMKDDFEEILPHTVGDMTTVLEATDSMEGRRESRCTVCNELLSWEIIPKLNSAVVQVYTYGNIAVGENISFYVNIGNVGYGTALEIIPRFDASVFEYVGGEWLIFGSGEIDAETMKATMAYDYESSLSGDVYCFTLRAKVPTNASSVSASAVIRNGGDVINSTSIENVVETVPCEHYYGTGVMIDESSHILTCIHCGYGEIRDHRFVSDSDMCCDDECGYHRGIIGDVDGDGYVDSEDALAVLDYVYNTWSYERDLAFDFDCTGYVDEYDAYNLLMYVFFPDTVICACGERAMDGRAGEAMDDAADLGSDTVYHGTSISIINPSNSSNSAKYGAFEIIYDEALMEFLYMNYEGMPGADYNEILYCVGNRLVFAYRSEHDIRSDYVTAELRVRYDGGFGHTTVGSAVRLRGDNGEFVADNTYEKYIFVSCDVHTFVENPADEFLKRGATCESKATYYKSCEICGFMSDETFKYGELGDHKWVDEDGETVCSVCDTVQSGTDGGSGVKPDKDKDGAGGVTGGNPLGLSMNTIIFIAAGVVVVIIIIIIIASAGKKKKKKTALSAPETVDNEPVENIAESAESDSVATDDAEPQTQAQEYTPQYAPSAQQSYAPQYNAGQQGYAPQYNAGQQGYAPQYNAGQQGYAPQYNAGQQGYAPQYNAGQQGYAPQYNAGQGYAPQYNAQQGYAPQYNAGQGYAPQYGAQQDYAPQYGAQQGYAPQYGAQQGYAPQYNAQESTDTESDAQK